MRPAKNHKKARVVPCGVALILRGREFLIAQRNAEDTLGSFWEFPGGKRERGETFEQCVAWEVLEELGVRVEVGKKFMDVRKKYKDRVIWLNFYFCAHVSGDPKPLDCQQVLWTDISSLKDYKFPPANDVVIQRLMESFSG